MVKHARLDNDNNKPDYLDRWFVGNKESIE